MNMNTMTWPQFSIVEPVRITPEEFATLPDVSKSPGSTADLVCRSLPAYTWGRALITTRRLYQDRFRARWHIVERQYHFGNPVYFARPIIIRLAAESLQ